MSAVQQVSRQQIGGFALMMAVFIIVTLAAIGVYLLTVSTGQLQAATQDEQGARAHQAARTGIEWAAFQILRNGGNCATVSTTLDLQQGLLGFHATIGCTVNTEDEGENSGANAIKVYQITVTGCNNNATCPLASPGPTYVERQLQLTLTQ
jgi:MSHA biogenesis protein MshP